jgi:hypothetical protein
MTQQTFQKDSVDDNEIFVIRRTWSDQDENTEAAGSNRGKNDEVEQEFLVKWQMAGNLSLKDAKQQLLGLLSELLMCYSNKVTYIDYRAREWMFTNNDKEEPFVREFQKAVMKLYAVRNKDQKILKWVVITKFRACRSLQDWRNNEYFYSMVMESKTYMFPHPFQQDEWEVSSIGFLKDIHVAHYTIDYLQGFLNTHLQKENTTTPVFQLIPQRITNKDKTATTRAYTIQCLKKDARELIQRLTHGYFRNNPIFIPFKYKTTQPEVFTKCIRRQNEVYYKTWVIKLEGLTKEAITHIQDEIHDIQGVFQIVPTKKFVERGEWKILVEQSKCQYVHRQITSKWDEITQHILPEALSQAPSQWPAPRVSSQRVRDYQDNSNESDSYGSILTTGTEMSTTLEDEDKLNDLPAAYTYPTYATAATRSQDSSVTSTQISSPTASTISEWHQEKKALEALIHQQAAQLDQIQADLQAKISRSRDLEDQLAQAIELAHSRDVRYEEMMIKFDMMMNKMMPNQGGSEGSTIIEPMEVEANDPNSTPKKKSPRQSIFDTPPPKKTNKNPTPEKPMYSIFQPSKDIPIPPPPRNQRPPPLLTQPTATEADMTKPKPGAKTGKKSE